MFVYFFWWSENTNINILWIYIIDFCCRAYSCNVGGEIGPGETTPFNKWRKRVCPAAPCSLALSSNRLGEHENAQIERHDTHEQKESKKDT
jgi:hypothetical protein